MVQPLWKTVWRCLRKLKIEVPFDPAIPLLGIYPEKTTTQKDTCTPMFIAALFAIPKKRKQPKCPSPENWIKKMWYIHTMEYYSTIKRKEIPAFLATWEDLEIIMLSETAISNAFTDMWNLKKGHNELLYRTDSDSHTFKNLWFPNETVWEVGRCTEGLGRKCYKIWLG